MRRGGGLWMVTLDNRDPEPFEELPYYFRTRKAAEWWRADREGWKAIGEWPWRADDTLVVQADPDGLTEHDIGWDDDQ